MGAFYASLGAGLTLSFWAGRFIKRRFLGAALAGLLAEGLLLMAISSAGSFVSVCILYMLLALASGIGGACLDTLLMRETPAKWQPLLFGLVTALGGTLLGLSMLLAGALVNKAEPRLLGFAGGAGFAAIAIVLAVYVWSGSRSPKEISAPSRTP